MFSSVYQCDGHRVELVVDDWNLRLQLVHPARAMVGSVLQFIENLCSVLCTSSPGINTVFDKEQNSDLQDPKMPFMKTYNFKDKSSLLHVYVYLTFFYNTHTHTPSIRGETSLGSQLQHFIYKRFSSKSEIFSYINCFRFQFQHFI